MKRLLFCFVLFVGLFASVQAASTFTDSATSGASSGSTSATLTIKALPTTNQWEVKLVATGTFGPNGFGNWQVNLNSQVQPRPYITSAPSTQIVTFTGATLGGSWGGGYQSGNLIPSRSIPTLTWAAPAKTPQTISVSPTSLTIDKGGDANFVVSGGNTPLIFSMEGAFPRLGAGAGAWGLKFDSIGIYSLAIYAEEDATYSKSNTVSIAVTVKGYSIKLALPANPSAYMIEYQVKQDGVDLFSTYQLAGAAAEIRTFQVPKSTPVTVTPVVVGLTKDGVLWTENAGGSTTLTPVIVTPQATVTGDETITSTGVPAASIPTKSELDDTKKTVWRPTDSSSPAATDNTVKEGTDKIVSSLDTLNATLKAGLNVTVSTTGGTGTNSDVGTHTRLDTANGHLEKLSTIATGGKGVADSVADKNAMLSGWAGGTFSDANTGAQTASDGVRTSIMAAGLDGTNPIPSKGNTGYVYNINAGGGIHTKKPFSFDLNPMTSPLIPQWLHSALSWVKAIIAFTAVGMLWLDTSKKTRQAILGVLQVNREGDTVVERASFTYLNSLGASAFGMGNIGTWAGFLGVIAARFIWFSIISGLFVAAIPALVSLLENVIFDDFATYKNLVASLSAQGGQFGQLMGMVLNLAPIWTLTACFIFRVTSDTLISAGVIPLALYLRLIKI